MKSFQAVKRIRDAGMTVLIVEQRMAECLDIADRAYILQTGRVLMQGGAGGDQGQSRRAEGVSGIVSQRPSLRGANGPRECAPDDRLRDEAIHLAPRSVWQWIASLRSQ